MPGKASKKGGDAVTPQNDGGRNAREQPAVHVASQGTQWWHSLLYAFRYACFVTCGTIVAVVDLWILIGGMWGGKRHCYIGRDEGGGGGAPSMCAVAFHPSSTRRSKFVFHDARFVVHRELLSRRMWSSVDAAQRPVAVVTGCTVGGIGWSTALHLMLAGVDVVMVCKEGWKAAEAMNEARTSIALHCRKAYALAVRSGVGAMRVLTADVGDVDAMVALGHRLVSSEPNLRIVVANAGYMACPARLTSSGFEEQMGTHVIGHGSLLLSILDAWGRLLSSPSNRRSAPPPLRIVVVSSAAAVGGSIPHSLTRHDSVEAMSRGYDRFQGYRDAKLTEAALALALARRVQQDARLRPSVTVNTLHPGPIWSNVVPNSKLELQQLLDWSVSSSIFRMSPHASGLFVVDLCVHEAYDHVSGHYFRMGVDMTAYYGGHTNWDSVWSPGLPTPRETSNIVKGEQLLKNIEDVLHVTSCTTS